MRESFSERCSLIDDKFMPCPDCVGGYVYYDEPDPEPAKKDGYDTLARMKCRTCRGTGIVPRYPEDKNYN